MGIQNIFISMKLGMVLICLNRIKERIKVALQEYNHLDEKSLKENLIFATLIIHEHTYAAIFEGINTNSSNMAFIAKWRNGKRFKAVSEGLAEWANDYKVKI
ncbi:MAG: hypothetical protein JG776_2324 [Caloramator sp.]|nr:hypothetical protein [Caloramator sp.]